MPPTLCETCNLARAQIQRPKTRARLCAPCFLLAFETEIAHTITSSSLFHSGERIAIGASGGKDSTVLASVLKTLNDRHDWGLDLCLLSIDEGITGYRDHSLDAVRRHSVQYGLPLTVVGYRELYGWSMDEVVAQVGKKGNCTYCGVFRRQALDRGAAGLGVRHVVTGHNADDVAETVVMNLLRGDLPRLGRATSIITSTPQAAAGGGGGKEGGEGEVGVTRVKRSKPLMFAYEKEIVMYAHHKKLDYFSTECIYSPEAFRGSARTLIKNLERIRPESIMDVVQSGIDMAKLVPNADGAGREEEGEAEGSCGSANGKAAGGEMAEMERKLRQDDGASGTETEIKLESEKTKTGPPHAALMDGQNYDKHVHAVPIRIKQSAAAPAPPKQKLGQCERCGYLSSQAVCKACMLLEGLNKARPKTGIEVG